MDAVTLAAANAYGKKNLDPVLIRGASRLRTFRAALANRAAGACDVLMVGDSITEGQGSSVIENRWASKFRDQLRSAYGVTGGRGYVPAVYAVSGYTQAWTLSGGAQVGGGSSFGLGKRYAILGAAGHTMTRSVPSGTTSVDIFVTQGWNGGASALSWQVDAGAATTVQTGGVANPTASKFRITLDGSAHTITLKWVSGGNNYVSGSMEYAGDETLGIRLWDGAHSGYKSSDLTSSTDVWLQDVGLIQPSLVLVTIGTNDWSGGANTAAQVAANVQATVNNIRGKCTIPPSVIVGVEYERVATGTPIDTWPHYVAALRKQAQADGDMAVFDLYSLMGTINSAATNALGLLYGGDLIHPTDKGHQLIADALVNFVRSPAAF